MIKKALHIILVIFLAIAVTGLSAEASICACLKKKAPKSCCKVKKDHHESRTKCCKKTTIVYRLDKNLLVSGTDQIQVPDLISISNPLFTFNDISISIENSESGQHYLSPPGIRDIPVLIQCFRN